MKAPTQKLLLIVGSLLIAAPSFASVSAEPQCGEGEHKKETKEEKKDDKKDAPKPS